MRDPFPQARGSLFPLGRILATPRAIEALEKAHQQPWTFLAKHACGDWGDLEAHDISEKELSLHHGLRLLSSYTPAAGDRLWWRLRSCPRTSATAGFRGLPGRDVSRPLAITL